MCYGKKILSAILATALILSLVACGGNHVEAPDETGDYTVNYHESVALPSINAEIEFTDFSIENLADDGAGDLNFYITLHLPDAADPASYAAWFSNFSVGNNEADYELVTIGDDGTGAYVQISEELDASFDTMIYHVFCTADLSGGSLSLTGSVNNDLNFEFEISENEVGSFLFEQAENLFENEQYDSSLTYYKFVSGAQKEKADIITFKIPITQLLYSAIYNQAGMVGFISITLSLFRLLQVSLIQALLLLPTFLPTNVLKTSNRTHRKK